MTYTTANGLGGKPLLSLGNPSIAVTYDNGSGYSFTMYTKLEHAFKVCTQNLTTHLKYVHKTWTRI